MLRKLSIRALLFSAFVFSSLSAEEPFDSKEDQENRAIQIEDRYYIEPGMLLMDQTGLYLNIEGTLFAVNKVQSDGRGVYVEDKVWDV